MSDAKRALAAFPPIVRSAVAGPKLAVWIGAVPLNLSSRRRATRSGSFMLVLVPTQKRSRKSPGLASRRSTWIMRGSAVESS